MWKTNKRTETSQSVRFSGSTRLMQTLKADEIHRMALKCSAFSVSVDCWLPKSPFLQTFLSLVSRELSQMHRPINASALSSFKESRFQRIQHQTESWRVVDDVIASLNEITVERSWINPICKLIEFNSSRRFGPTDATAFRSVVQWSGSRLQSTFNFDPLISIGVDALKRHVFSDTSMSSMSSQ